MGLLKPTDGFLKIDDIIINDENIRSYQMNIAHVPQSVYLSDSTIYENIAFGIDYDKIDKFKVIESAKLAMLDKFINTLDNGYNSMAGERGVKFSGGQRQRIGIARALYKESEILVLDEATSALDTDTESSIMESIENLNKNKTIIIIAHRISTLSKCNRIIKLDKGNLIEVQDFHFKEKDNNHTK